MAQAADALGVTVRRVMTSVVSQTLIDEWFADYDFAAFFHAVFRRLTTSVFVSVAKIAFIPSLSDRTATVARVFANAQRS